MRILRAADFLEESPKFLRIFPAGAVFQAQAGYNSLVFMKGGERYFGKSRTRAATRVRRGGRAMACAVAVFMLSLSALSGDERAVPAGGFLYSEYLKQSGPLSAGSFIDSVREPKFGEASASFAVQTDRRFFSAGATKVTEAARDKAASAPLRDWTMGYLADGDSDLRDVAAESMVYARTAGWELAELAAGEFAQEIAAGALRSGFVRNVGVDLQSSLGGRAGAGALYALGSLHDSALHAAVWEARAFKEAGDRTGGNIGAIYRRRAGAGMAGINVYADYEAGDAGSFARWSAGAEWRSPWIDFHANFYNAITEARSRDMGAAESEVNYSAGGRDALARLHSPGAPWLSAVAGYYSYEGQAGDDDDQGLRAGFEYNPLNAPLNLELLYDTAKTGDSVGGMISFRHDFRARPLSPRRGSHFRPQDWFFAPVEREYSQRIRNSRRDSSGGTWLLRAVEGGVTRVSGGDASAVIEYSPDGARATPGRGVFSIEGRGFPARADAPLRLPSDAALTIATPPGSTAVLAYETPYGAGEVRIGAPQCADGAACADAAAVVLPMQARIEFRNGGLSAAVTARSAGGGLEVILSNGLAVLESNDVRAGESGVFMLRFEAGGETAVAAGGLAAVAAGCGDGPSALGAIAISCALDAQFFAGGRRITEILEVTGDFSSPRAIATLAATGGQDASARSTVLVSTHSALSLDLASGVVYLLPGRDAGETAGIAARVIDFSVPETSTASLQVRVAAVSFPVLQAEIAAGGFHRATIVRFPVIGNLSSDLPIATILAEGGSGAYVFADVTEPEAIRLSLDAESGVIYLPAGQSGEAEIRAEARDRSSLNAGAPPASVYLHVIVTSLRDAIVASFEDASGSPIAANSEANALTISAGLQTPAARIIQSGGRPPVTYEMLGGDAELSVDARSGEIYVADVEPGVLMSGVFRVTDTPETDEEGMVRDAEDAVLTIFVRAAFPPVNAGFADGVFDGATLSRRAEQSRRLAIARVEYSGGSGDLTVRADSGQNLAAILGVDGVLELDGGTVFIPAAGAGLLRGNELLGIRLLIDDADRGGEASATLSLFVRLTGVRNEVSPAFLDLASGRPIENNSQSRPLNVFGGPGASAPVARLTLAGGAPNASLSFDLSSDGRLTLGEGGTLYMAAGAPFGEIFGITVFGRDDDPGTADGSSALWVRAEYPPFSVSIVSAPAAPLTGHERLSIPAATIGFSGGSGNLIATAMSGDLQLAGGVLRLPPLDERYRAGDVLSVIAEITDQDFRNSVRAPARITVFATVGGIDFDIIPVGRSSVIRAALIDPLTGRPLIASASPGAEETPLFTLTVVSAGSGAEMVLAHLRIEGGADGAFQITTQKPPSGGDFYGLALRGTALVMRDSPPGERILRPAESLILRISDYGEGDDETPVLLLTVRVQAINASPLLLPQLSSGAYVVREDEEGGLTESARALANFSYSIVSMPELCRNQAGCSAAIPSGHTLASVSGGSVGRAISRDLGELDNLADALRESEGVANEAFAAALRAADADSRLLKTFVEFSEETAARLRDSGLATITLHYRGLDGEDGVDYAATLTLARIVPLLRVSHGSTLLAGRGTADDPYIAILEGDGDIEQAANLPTVAAHLAAFGGAPEEDPAGAYVFSAGPHPFLVFDEASREVRINRSAARSYFRSADIEPLVVTLDDTGARADESGPALASIYVRFAQPISGVTASVAYADILSAISMRAEAVADATDGEDADEVPNPVLAPQSAFNPSRSYVIHGCQDGYKNLICRRVSLIRTSGGLQMAFDANFAGDGSDDAYFSEYFRIPPHAVTVDVRLGVSDGAGGTTVQVNYRIMVTPPDAPSPPSPPQVSISIFSEFSSTIEVSVIGAPENSALNPITVDSLEGGLPVATIAASGGAQAGAHESATLTLSPVLINGFATVSYQYRIPDLDPAQGSFLIADGVIYALAPAAGDLALRVVVEDGDLVVQDFMQGIFLPVPPDAHRVYTVGIDGREVVRVASDADKTRNATVTVHLRFGGSAPIADPVTLAGGATSYTISYSQYRGGALTLAAAMFGQGGSPSAATVLAAAGSNPEVAVTARYFYDYAGCSEERDPSQGLLGPGICDLPRVFQPFSIADDIGDIGESAPYNTAALIKSALVPPIDMPNPVRRIFVLSILVSDGAGNRATREVSLHIIPDEDFSFGAITDLSGAPADFSALAGGDGTQESPFVLYVQPGPSSSVMPGAVLTVFSMSGTEYNLQTAGGFVLSAGVTAQGESLTLAPGAALRFDDASAARAGQVYAVTIRASREGRPDVKPLTMWFELAVRSAAPARPPLPPRFVSSYPGEGTEASPFVFQNLLEPGIQGNRLVDLYTVVLAAPDLFVEETRFDGLTITLADETPPFVRVSSEGDVFSVSRRGELRFARPPENAAMTLGTTMSMSISVSPPPPLAAGAFTATVYQQSADGGEEAAATIHVRFVERIFARVLSDIAHPLDASAFDNVSVYLTSNFRLEFGGGFGSAPDDYAVVQNAPTDAEGTIAFFNPDDEYKLTFRDGYDLLEASMTTNANTVTVGVNMAITVSVDDSNAGPMNDLTPAATEVFYIILGHQATSP